MARCCVPRRARERPAAVGCPGGQRASCNKRVCWCGSRIQEPERHRSQHCPVANRQAHVEQPCTRRRVRKARALGRKGVLLAAGSRRDDGAAADAATPRHRPPAEGSHHAPAPWLTHLLRCGQHGVGGGRQCRALGHRCCRLRACRPAEPPGGLWYVVACRPARPRARRPYYIAAAGHRCGRVFAPCAQPYFEG